MDCTLIFWIFYVRAGRCGQIDLFFLNDGASLKSKVQEGEMLKIRLLTLPRRQ